MLRFHGSRAKKDFEYIGYNSRLDAIQAAALRIFLPHLDEWTRLRREAAARYAELGLGEIAELPRDEPGHVYHMYAVRTPERDRLAAALAEAGIGARLALHDAAAPPAGAALPRLLRGRPARDREGRAREPLPAALGRHLDASSRSEVAAVLRQASSLVAGVIALPVTRHRLWQLARRRRR